MVKVFTRHLFILVFFILNFYASHSQCIVNAYASEYEICKGEAVILYAAGSCGSVKNTSFNELSLPPGWQTCCNPTFGTFCGPSLDNSPYFWFGEFSYGSRYLQTDTFHIDTIGCLVQWEMKYGDVQASPDCDPPDDSIEGVLLQYSQDYGSTWKNIDYWSADSNTQGPLYTWNIYTKTIPDSMVGFNNAMRWVQLNNSGLGTDSWGLDNVSISCPDISLITWSTGFTGPSGGTMYPQSDTFYIVTIQDTINNFSSTDTVFIKVYPSPTSDFTPDTNIVCEGETITLTYLGNASASANYLWNFNGGKVASGSGQGPVSVYWSGAGNYDVSLKVSDNNCTSATYDTLISVKTIPLVTIYTATYSGCQPLRVDYYNISTPMNLNCWWDFGDGNSSTQSNPTHIYNQLGAFNLTFIGTSQYGCADTLFFNDFTKVYLKPKADFTASDFNVSIQNPSVQFMDKSSSDVISYLWNFGDSKQSSLQNPMHTFNALGDYDVSLITTNSFNCKDTIVKKLLVTLTDIPDYYDNSDEISIYGTDGNYNLFVNGLSGDFQLSILNSMMQRIMTREIKIPTKFDFKMDLKLTSFPKGFYFLHLGNDKKSYLKKFLLK